VKNPEKVAIVTGAGTGIGRQTALALLREGYAVSLAGRRMERLQETVDQAGAAGARALAVPADVSDPASVRTLFDKTKEVFGRLDLLFNNAGTGAPPVPLEAVLEQWKPWWMSISPAYSYARRKRSDVKSQRPMGGSSATGHIGPPGKTPRLTVPSTPSPVSKSTASTAQVRYRLWPDRHQTRRPEMAQPMKAGRVAGNGTISVEPTMM
jgi:hypothetical protein